MVFGQNVPETYGSRYAFYPLWVVQGTILGTCGLKETVNHREVFFQNKPRLGKRPDCKPMLFGQNGPRTYGVRYAFYPLWV